MLSDLEIPVPGASGFPTNPLFWEGKEGGSSPGLSFLSTGSTVSSFPFSKDLTTMMFQTSYPWPLLGPTDCSQLTFATKVRLLQEKEESGENG